MPVRNKGLCAAGETVKGSLGYVILQHEDVKTITQTTPARLGEGLSLRNNCVMTKKWTLIRDSQMLLEVKAGNPGLAPAPYKDIFIFTEVRQG